MLEEDGTEETVDLTSAPLVEMEDVLSPTGGSGGAIAAMGGSSVADLVEQHQLPKPSHGIWDPLNCPDWELPPSRMCLQRIRRDLMSLYEEPPHGVFAVPDDDNATTVHALIIGPYDTPYEGGFFYFVLRMPPDYPIKPPRVRLMTTGDGKVRFNPNLYRDGKVCLSILGTWSGPSWSPAQSLTSVLVSIQSLLNENPYHNEPGYDKEHLPGDSRRYNEIVEHETIRVAVCGSLEGCHGSDRRLPQALKDVMKRSFPQFYDHYVDVSRRLSTNLQGAPMIDPFGEQRGRFDPNRLLQRLETLKESLVTSLQSDELKAGENREGSSVNDDPMEIP